MENGFGYLIQAFHGVIAGVALGGGGRVGEGGGMDQVGDGFACHLDGEMEGFHVA